MNENQKDWELEARALLIENTELRNMIRVAIASRDTKQLKANYEELSSQLYEQLRKSN